MGETSAEALRHYASQYYWQVANFPRYLSRLHSQTESLEARQAILRNLNDEENPAQPHPELWLDFAEALGLDRAQVRAAPAGPAAQALVDEFHAVTAAGQAEALGALLAYESQVPAVAEFKSKALKKFYLKGEAAAKGARFFDVHAEADVWHTRELELLVATLPPADQLKVQAAADRCAQALWKFLDAMPA
jgi:pyrroloquinoline-quinone synthase